MLREIEKLDTSLDTNFNKIDVARKIRMLSLKINEIIDVVNSMNVKELEDDDDEDVVIKESDLKNKFKK